MKLKRNEECECERKNVSKQSVIELQRCNIYIYLLLNYFQGSKWVSWISFELDANRKGCR